MIADSIAIDELLLVLKIAFLVLLYLFIWQIVRSASRDIRLPQESMILRPGEPGAQMLTGRPAGGRLVVVKSPTLAKGEDFTLNTRAVTIGRGPRTTSSSRETSTRPPATPTSTRARTAPGSSTGARRTARS